MVTYVVTLVNLVNVIGAPITSMVSNHDEISFIETKWSFFQTNLIKYKLLFY